MKNLFKSIKDTVNKALGREEELDLKSSSEKYEGFSAEKGPITPGLEDKEEDVGKKVFEKTGRGREGIGQSSTSSSLHPQENPIKTNQGDKEKYRRPYNKKYHHYNKKKSGNPVKKDSEKNPGIQ